MKIFLCETKNGDITKLTLAKIIKRKREGREVKIIGVDSVKEKGVK